MDATHDPETATVAAPSGGTLPAHTLTANLTDGQVNTMYRYAYNLTQKGRHDQAVSLFGLLSLYRPKDAKFPRAVAVCYRRIGRLEDAIHMFARTLELAPADHWPALQLVECLLQLGRRESAHELLMTIAAVARQRGDETTCDRATGMIELMEGAPT
jgi:Flp pilus assembly protein TadD